MSQQYQTYNGTTYLLVTVQILGWLSIAGSVILYFSNNANPFALQSAMGGAILGMFTLVAGCIGRIFVDVAETYMNNYAAQISNQATQIKLAEALLETSRANGK